MRGLYSRHTEPRNNLKRTSNQRKKCEGSILLEGRSTRRAFVVVARPAEDHQVQRGKASMTGCILLHSQVLDLHPKALVCSPSPGPLKRTNRETPPRRRSEVRWAPVLPLHLFSITAGQKGNQRIREGLEPALELFLQETTVWQGGSEGSTHTGGVRMGVRKYRGGGYEICRRQVALNGNKQEKPTPVCCTLDSLAGIQDHPLSCNAVGARGSETYRLTWIPAPSAGAKPFVEVSLLTSRNATGGIELDHCYSVGMDLQPQGNLQNPSSVTGESRHVILARCSALMRMSIHAGGAYAYFGVENWGPGYTYVKPAERGWQIHGFGGVCPINGPIAPESCTIPPTAAVDPGQWLFRGMITDRPECSGTRLGLRGDMIINPAGPPKPNKGAPYGMESCLIKNPNGTYFAFWDTSAWANVAGHARDPQVVRSLSFASTSCLVLEVWSVH
jgi:hypothetical protein